MSYNAADEAWKQRVAKELNKASQFRRSYDSFFRSSRALDASPTISKTIHSFGVPNHPSTFSRPLSVHSKHSSSSSRLGKQSTGSDNRKVSLHIGIGGDSTVSRSTYKTMTVDSRVTTPRDLMSMKKSNSTRSITSHKRIIVGNESPHKTPRNSGKLDPIGNDVFSHPHPTDNVEVSKDSQYRADDSKSVNDPGADQLEFSHDGQSSGSLQFAEACEPAGSDRPPTSSTLKSTISQRRQIQDLQRQLNELKIREATFTGCGTCSCSKA